MSVAGQLEKAVSLNEQGNISLAVACLDDIEAQIPDQAGFQKFVGLLYQSMGEDAKSIRFLRRAMELAPDDPELESGLGYHFMDNGEPGRAVAHFRRAYAAETNNENAALNLARCLDFVGEFAEAESLLRPALTSGRDSYETLCHLGRIIIHAGRPGEGVAIFERALAELPEDPVIAEMGLRRARYLVDRTQELSSPSFDAPAATLVCVKHGTLYGPEYVNRLAAMVRRNSSVPVRVVCFTEDPSGIDRSVEHRPLPAPDLTGWWNKVGLFKSDLGDVGERILFMDLDVVITGSVDPLLRCESDFTIMENDYVTGYNTSVMLLKVGARPSVWEAFSPAAVQSYGGDQDWVAMNAPDADLWPTGWCVPYRLRAAKAPPPDARVVCFCGRPNPDEYPAAWIEEYWR